ncbi:GroES-like protein [Aulographum hederae CBS 113979]|uniref:GroES-like protein n=1 Tax=Aulographum hederae CBS 113979 TaxID=1176131 RepID=A0A6G1HAZ9_9PEZI|nr:GroES-like protein [Aulographum hederae CBS 113979]
MKAAQWDPVSKTIQLNDIPKPEPRDGQFLVKIKTASLCHSDLIMSIRPPGDKPVTLGHEGVGFIEKIGPEAENRGFKVGDAIGFLYINGVCYECEGCQIHNLQCQKGSPELQGFVTDGYFQEYTVVDWQNAIVLPKNLDITRCAPLFCAGITAFHAIDSCELKPGQWISIIGTGGLGQLAIQYAKAMGANVIGIDINDNTLEIAKKAGADAVFNSRTNKDYAAEVKKLSNGGCHATAVFSAAKPAYDGAPSVLRLNGLIMIVGLPMDNIEVNTTAMAIGLYRIKAESTSTPQRMPKAIEFSAKHNILPEVEFRPFEDIPCMVEEMRAGKMSKRSAVNFF